MTDESTREISRRDRRIVELEAKVQRLKAALTEIAEHGEIAWATVGVGHALAIKFCRIASEALKTKE
jgi:glutamate-1-semialdehyde aminotransferase